MLFKPYMYRKDIFDVDYHKLKQDGVKCIVFDLDNTLSFVSENKCSLKVKKLLMKLKKDFFICISSNSTKKRIIPYLDDLDIDGVSFSLKPLPKALIKIRKRYGFSKNEMVMIGDQLLTDVLAGNSYGIRPILVDPMGKVDFKVTALNRRLESWIFKRYAKRGILERGKYYE